MEVSRLGACLSMKQGEKCMPSLFCGEDLKNVLTWEKHKLDLNRWGWAASMGSCGGLYWDG